MSDKIFRKERVFLFEKKDHFAVVREKHGKAELPLMEDRIMRVKAVKATIIFDEWKEGEEQ